MNIVSSDGVKIKRNLNALITFSKNINSCFELKQILNNILLTCMGKFFVTKGAIVINEGENFSLKISKGMSLEFENNFPKTLGHNFLENNEIIKKIFKNEHISCIEGIVLSDKCLGFVFLGEKLNKIPFTNEDIQLLKTILNISSTAIQNSMMINELKRVNKKLDSRINRLNSLFELSKEFGLFAESTKIARLLAYSIIGQFMISKYAVIIFNDDDIEILETKYPEDTLRNNLSNCPSRLIDKTIYKANLPKEYNSLSEIEFEIIVPMQIKGKTKGLILLGKRINELPFSEADIEYIYSVGGLAIISLENKRLFKEELEKHKLEEELELAREIQRNLLPNSIPQIDNIDLAAENISSKQVGGDYYDIIQKNDGTFYLAIADVSGKGAPAALLMANLQAFLKSICRQDIGLIESTALINDLITENITGGKFITFFWASVDAKNKRLSYVNAGHNPPLLLRNGKIIKLEKGGIILGVMKTDIPYLSETIQLEKNDKLILFTDGITEAMDKNGEEYSDEKLEEFILNIKEKSSQEILKAIKKDVQNFASGAPQSDDITLLVLNVL